MLSRKELGKLGEYFTDKDNVLIKRDLLSAIHKATSGCNEMSEERLDKAIKKIRYTIQLYKLSDEMSRKIVSE
jgi:hypothetical protein